MIKFTRENIDQLSRLKSHDSNNLTVTCRGSKTYAKTFRINDMENYLNTLVGVLGHKIRILDAGCGEGYAISDFLSKKLFNYVDNVTGISLHYFSRIETVLRKHNTRFTYYYGRIQDILPTISDNFDLIFDTSGCYTYSEDKLALLEQYYNCLQPSGHAFIFSPVENIFVSENELDVGTEEMFVEWVQRSHPEIFTVTNSIYKDTHCVQLIRTDVPWPIPKYTIISSSKVPAFQHQSFTISQFRKGNAVLFRRVRIKFSV